LKNNVVIFAGTTEGRSLVEAVIDAINNSSIAVKNEDSAKKTVIHVCVTTEYGKGLMTENEFVKIHVGTLDEVMMAEFFEKENIGICFDATHPYATVVTRNLVDICKEKEIQYYRLERASEIEKIPLDQDVVLVSSVEAAVDYLKNTKGMIFIATGSKELKAFTSIDDYENRCVARVLSTENVVLQCKELGFEGKNLICMQGPFSEELNYAMLMQTKAKYFVTKESGKAGGFLEKYQAVKRANATMVVIKRPEPEENIKNSEIDVTEAVNIILNAMPYLTSDSTTDSMTEKNPLHQEFLMVAMGPGNINLLTNEARTVLEKADCIIGASRLVESAKVYLSEKNTNGQMHLMQKKCEFVCEYKTDAILKYIENHPEYHSFAFVFSGDVGFYSGAKKLSASLKEKGKSVQMIPGISSPIYLCDRVGITWQDMKFLSIHGVELSLEETLLQYEKVSFLIGDREDGAMIAQTLCKLNKDGSKMVIGQRLSYENEEIIIEDAEKLCEISIDPLSVVIVGGFNE